jgi:hypothetical protein
MKRTLTAIVLTMLAPCASVQAKTANERWKEAIDYAFSVKPQLYRGCYPKHKYCNLQVQYFSPKDNHYIILEIEEDFNEKPIARYICKMNVTKDIQHCVNWDSGEKDIAVKNATTGQFERVENNNATLQDGPTNGRGE